MIFSWSEQNHRLKWLFSNCINGAWGNEPDGETDVVCIRATDFERALGRLNKGNRTLRSIDSATYGKLALRHGDIILEKSGGGEKQLVGRAAIFDGQEPSITSNFLARCRPAPGMNPVFINYLLLAIYNARGTFPHIKQSIGIQNLDQASFLNIRINVPQLNTQRRIEEYLDHKTVLIDELIKKKRELLDLLAEKRQALITQAVTTGLPDLQRSDYDKQDLNRREDCRAEGKRYVNSDNTLPQNWSSKRLKYLATYNDEVLPENSDEENEINYIEISGISLSRGIEQIEHTTFGQAPSRARRIVRSGDILISTVRTYLRAIATLDEVPSNLIASTGFCVIRPKNGVDNGFLGWAVKSELFISEVVARSVGVSYPAINASDLVTIYIPLPPRETQCRIAEFLDETTARIDRLTERIRNSVALLEEYRSAQITAVVTGQISVP